MSVHAIKSDIEQLCETTRSAKSSYLNTSVLKHHMQSAATEYIIVINKKLNSSATHSEGLELLQVLIDCCSDKLLAENAVSWIRMLINYRSKHINSQQLVIIEKLISVCAGIQDFRKAILTDYLPSIVDLCTTPSYNPNLLNAALNCLIICSKKFPKACGPFKKKTELFLLQYLNEQLLSTEQVKTSAVAFHYLQQVGEGDGIHHQNNWSSALHKLCMTTHALFNVLFEDVIEFGNFENIVDTPVHEFPALPSTLEKYEMLQIHYNRLRNCLIFIRAMLDKHFTVPKVIPLQTIMNVISRGLSVHVCPETQSVASLHLSLIITRCQVDLLYLLRSLIACTTHQLKPFSFIITKLLMDCLSRTQRCGCFNSTSDYQCTVYKVFKYWVTIARNAVSDSFHEKFINLVKTDIFPNEQKTLLQLTILNTSKKSKKRKLSQNADVSTIAKDTTSLHINKSNKICTASLECLIAILECTCLNIGPAVTEELYKGIVKTLLDIQSGKISQIYKNPKCRALLYTVLTSLMQQPSLKIPPPLAIAINLQVDRIKGNPSRDINIMETICQPAYPPLQMQQQISCSTEKTSEEVCFDEFNFDNSSPVVNEKLPVDDDVEADDEEVIVIENEEVNQPKSPRVHIIDNILIKAPVVENGFSNNHHETTEKEIHIDQSIKNELKTLHQVTVDLTNNQTDVNDLQHNEDTNSNSFKIKTTDSNSIKRMTADADEEPVSKKHKEDVEIHEEDMMDSFRDVINDY